MKKECIAMLLAGGQGSRLGVLTRDVAKPAIPFGGKYRIIDFPLSNCSNSGIDTVGVLTQYRPLKLNSYIGTGQPWDLDRKDGGVFVLPPYIKGKAGEWYSGTANAITQNMEFIEQYCPEYILILSGDHIYTMDYNKMLQFHKENNAAATISVLEVTLEEASRFGIMNTNEDGVIYEFEEKPAKPKSNKASMGVYIFSWELLRKYLIADEKDNKSHHDFGKNIIPAMLNDGLKLYAYDFEGYWKDVGTADSLWQSNMDLLGLDPGFELSDGVNKVYARNLGQPAHYIADTAVVKDVIIGEGGQIFGSAYHSIISTRATIGEGSVVKNSVLMPYVHIGKNCIIEKAMIAEGTRIEDNCHIGSEDGKKLTVIGAKLNIPSGISVEEGREIDEEKLNKLISEYADGKEKIIC
ncbi:MAG: glucose-1-phosphate adenylyltransferase [Clostridiales bacterium]|nr:glucose-1-phosphate adenylyltransferase [Clostridiales bacterium]